MRAPRVKIRSVRSWLRQSNIRLGRAVCAWTTPELLLGDGDYERRVRSGCEGESEGAELTVKM
jgi:hypothetical protein